jgi:hypothetical protein
LQYADARLARVCCALRVASCSWKIVIIRIFANGSTGGELRGKTSHAFANQFERSGWYPVLTAIVELLNNLLLS